MAATTTFVSMRQQRMELVDKLNDDMSSCGERLALAAARQKGSCVVHHRDVDDLLLTSANGS